VDESLLCFGVASEIRGKELESDVPVELQILGFVDHAHTSAAEVFEYLVMTDRGADHRDSSEMEYEV
jgi:hypothetical protein